MPNSTDKQTVTKNMKTKIAVLLTFMFVGALIPKKFMNGLIDMGFQDPHFHMAAFAGICLVCLWIFRQSVVLTVLFCVSLAVLTEVAQSVFTTTRHFNWEDVRDDSKGLLIGLTLFFLWKLKYYLVPIIFRKSKRYDKKLLLTKYYFLRQWREFVEKLQFGKTILLLPVSIFQKNR